MTTPATLRALAAEMCEAKKGSRELDAQVAEAIGNPVEVIKVPKDHPVFKEGGGLEFMTLPDGRRVGIPLYTTSLDAKLPGEDVVVVYAPGRKGNDKNKPSLKWAALNSGPPLGLWAYAHTEPLARRAAGLLAMAEQKEREE